MELIGFEIDHSVEGGGKHGDTGALKNGGKSLVECIEELRRFIPMIVLLFNESAQHRNDECGTNSMAHDVADQNPDFGW